MLIVPRAVKPRTTTTNLTFKEKYPKPIKNNNLGQVLQYKTTVDEMGTISILLFSAVIDDK